MDHGKGFDCDILMRTREEYYRESGDDFVHKNNKYLLYIIYFIVVRRQGQKIIVTVSDS